MSPLHLFRRIKKATTKYSSFASTRQHSAHGSVRETGLYDPSAQDGTIVVGAASGDIAAVYSSLNSIYRTASVSSMDSQCTLVEPPGGTLYITQSSGGGGGYRRPTAGVADGRRPRSQFTIGPRRVIVCV